MSRYAFAGYFTVGYELLPQLYGGAGIGGQIKQLERKPQIVVATPGRLMDHYNRKTIRLDKIQTVVLDEADRMLDMGFFKDVTRIIDKVKNRKNLGLFSATISQEVMTVSWMYQRDRRYDLTQHYAVLPVNASSRNVLLP